MKRPKRVQSKFFRLFSVISIVLASVFVFISLLINSVIPDFFYNLVNIVWLVVGYSIFAGFCFGWCYNRYSEQAWTLLVDDIGKAMRAVENGNYNYKMKTYMQEDASTLVVAFNAMTRKLYQNESELSEQTKKIYNQNNEIIKANKDLYDSYKDLTGTYNLLNESEHKYYSLVNNLSDLVCVIKFDGTIYFVNNAIKEVLGYTKEEIEGRKIYDLKNDKVSLEVLNKFGKKLKNKKSIELALKLSKKDGKLIMTEIVLTKFDFDGEYVGIQAIVRDVTKAKGLEQQLVDTNKKLSIVNNISKQLNLSLEFKNIINVIVDKIANTLKVPVCCFSVLNKITNEFEPKAYAGKSIDNELVKKYGIKKYSFNQNIVKKMFENLDPIIVSEFTNDELVKEINKKSKKVKEVILVPVKIKDKPIGILSVYSSTKIIENQINLLSSISNNIAIAIENAMLYESSQKYFIRTVDALIAVIEAKDKYTEGHSVRVANYATKIAQELNLDKSEIEQIRIAGVLHDVGKIGVPDSVLNKPGKLTKEEFEEIKKHPITSNKILENVGFPEPVVNAIIMHHERWDGKGYPYGKKGKELTKGAQIIAVADALDAMISKRAYRDCLPLDVALREIENGKGTQFNSEIVDTLAKVIQKGNFELDLR